MTGLLSVTNCFKSCFAMSRQLMLRRGATATTIQTTRNIFFRRKNSESAALDLNLTKSEYDIELERVIKKEKSHEEFGLDDDPYTDRLLTHLVMFMGISVAAIFLPIMVFYYGPDHRSRMIEWRRYEAAKLIEEREARGELPIDENFVPPDLIESMVPPAGDWEEEWLRTQPSVRSKALRHYWVEASSW